MGRVSLAQLRERYLRRLPTKFCPGCGNGMVLNAFIRAIHSLGIDTRELVCVSGIGCSAWIPSPHVRADTMHVTHGRALAFATGIKLYRPELRVVAFLGDGDGAGIGGNHLIHAARRNLGVTAILVNNGCYGMTGGQVAPTTPLGLRTPTTPYGNPEPPFDLCRLVEAAGATYVARWTTYHLVQLERSIGEALQNEGFSFIEVISQCPTRQARMLGVRGPVWEVPGRLLEVIRDSVYPAGRPPEKVYVRAEEGMKLEGAREKIILRLGRCLELDGGRKIVEELRERGLEAYTAEEALVPVGVLHRSVRPEYSRVVRGG